MTNTPAQPIIEHMSDIATERNPPTLADIVREKTDNGRRIIDFFLDVMEDRIVGAQLCHRMHAARQLQKLGSRDAAKFIAKYSGVPCGHEDRRRSGPADQCSGADDEGQGNAPAPFSQDLLTVLSGIDEDLMTRVVRAQTADGDTIIEFLDDVMQGRNDGFKPHHRIAAARELSLHIVRDETPAPTAPGGEPAPAKTGVPGQSEAHSTHSEHNPTSVHPDHSSFVIPAEAGTHPTHSEHNPTSVHPDHSSFVIPAEAGTHPTHSEHNPTSVHPDHSSFVIPAEAGTHPTHTEHNPTTRDRGEERKRPTPVELTPAERRTRDSLEQHGHKPGPRAAPIDSTHPGRSPPR